tara:strand:+ start:3969 stop:4421 length:453 start_codon:yes stop_codon:yes gene_type:complete
MNNLDDFNEFNDSLNEERNDATTRDLASKVTQLFYNTEFWRFRDAMNLVIRRHYNRKAQFQESVLTESKISNQEFYVIKQQAEDYPLEDGSRLYVWEETISGKDGKGEKGLKMALANGTLVDFKKVEKKLQLRHMLDIEGWMDDVEEANK